MIQNFKIVTLALCLVVGVVVAGWAGGMLFAWLWIAVVWFFKQPQQVKAQNEIAEPRNNGVLVPARRGKPDPTRPNWRDEMSGSHYQRERMK